MQRDINYYLNQDQNDIMEWTDEVPFYNNFSFRVQQKDYDTPKPIFWKNAYWSMKWRIIPERIHGYVALNHCSKLPDDWKLKYKYSFALCPIPVHENENDDEDSSTDEDPALATKWTGIDTHTFTKPIGVENHDYSILFLPAPAWIAANGRTYVTPDNKVLLKCRLEAIPIPFECPLGYNSKKSTNMVGLKKLGATCYLNALLQVIF
jgi:hypothetical protein